MAPVQRPGAVAATRRVPIDIVKLPLELGMRRAVLLSVRCFAQPTCHLRYRACRMRHKNTQRIQLKFPMCLSLACPERRSIGPKSVVGELNTYEGP